jgi:hypothetical protein
MPPGRASGGRFSATSTEIATRWTGTVRRHSSSTPYGPWQRVIRSTIFVFAIMKFMAFRVVTLWGKVFYAQSNAAYAFGGVPGNETTDDETEIDLVPTDERTAVVATIEAFDRTVRTQGMGHRNVVVRVLEQRRWDLVEPENLLK